MYSVDVVYDIWQTLKYYILDKADQLDAAVALVDRMIENDVSVEEIREAFSGDSAIQSAISDYLRGDDYGRSHDEQEEEYEEYEDDNDDDSWN